MLSVSNHHAGQITALAKAHNVSIDDMLEILIDSYQNPYHPDTPSQSATTSNTDDDLKYANVRYEGIFAQSNDAIFLIDLDGKHFDVNQRAMDLLGYTYEEFLTLYTHDVVKDEEFPETLDIQSMLLNGDKVPIYERTLLHKSGAEIPVEVNVTCIFSEDDQPLYIQAMNRDIRERKHLLQEIQYRELRYRTILDTMAEGVIMYDTQGDPLLTNPAAEDLLGVPHRKMRGSAVTPSRRVIHQDGRDFPLRDLPLNISLREGVAVFGTIMGVEDPDTHLITWLSVNSVPIKNEHDTITDVIVTFSDFTRVMLAQKQALKLAVERERIHLITDFVQNSSHEFRTPLSIIQTNSYFLQRQHPDDTQILKRVSEINNQVKRITHLVDTLLLMAKLDSISILQPNLNINLSMLLSDMVLVQSSKENMPQINLHIDETTRQIAIPSLSNYLVQGLQAIIDNAILYCDSTSEIDITLTKSDNMLHITITDYGIGIAEEDLPHIFTRFWRRDTAHTHQGLGLGLSIAQRVIELHHGYIKVESQLNHGTSITVTLPIDDTHLSKSLIL